jgi:hypothetical protein
MEEQKTILLKLDESSKELFEKIKQLTKKFKFKEASKLL